MTKITVKTEKETIDITAQAFEYALKREYGKMLDLVEEISPWAFEEFAAKLEKYGKAQLNTSFYFDMKDKMTPTQWNRLTYLYSAEWTVAYVKDLPKDKVTARDIQELKAACV